MLLCTFFSVMEKEEGNDVQKKKNWRAALSLHACFSLSNHLLLLFIS